MAERPRRTGKPSSGNCTQRASLLRRSTPEPRRCSPRPADTSSPRPDALIAVRCAVRGRYGLAPVGSQLASDRPPGRTRIPTAALAGQSVQC
jgi:hypothetical protein